MLCDAAELEGERQNRDTCGCHPFLPPFRPPLGPPLPPTYDRKETWWEAVQAAFVWPDRFD